MKTLLLVVAIFVFMIGCAITPLPPPSVTITPNYRLTGQLLRLEKPRLGKLRILWQWRLWLQWIRLWLCNSLGPWLSEVGLRKFAKMLLEMGR